MKKVIENNIIGFIIGAIIFGIAGVGATTYLFQSNQVSYTKEGSNVTDVKQALDELYTLQSNGSGKVATGNIPVGTNGTYTVTGLDFEPNIGYYLYSNSSNYVWAGYLGGFQIGYWGSDGKTARFSYNGGTFTSDGFTLPIQGTIVDSHRTWLVARIEN